MKKPKRSKSSTKAILTEVYSATLALLAERLLLDDEPKDRDIYALLAEIQDITWEYQYALQGFALISEKEMQDLYSAKEKTK